MIRVLIVEDDPMVAKFNRHYLEQITGFVFAGWAASGAEAEKLLASQEVDLVLLDVYMPHTNGLQLLASLRSEGSTVDVIVISAASDQVSIRQALQLGAVDYLIKPFEFARFQAALTFFQQQYQLMRRDAPLNQEELDRLLGHTSDDGQGNRATLPKGLTKGTLQQVWTTISELPLAAFSTDDLSAKLPISRISVRKYLAFLTECGVLSMEASYGAVGRPVYMYRVTADGAGIMSQYI